MKKETSTYRENIEQAIACLEDNLKNDTFDWTRKYASYRFNVAKRLIDSAMSEIAPHP
jgi:hypothetical protein